MNGAVLINLVASAVNFAFFFVWHNPINLACGIFSAIIAIAFLD